MLITIDSAPLHLAKAVPELPVIALYDNMKEDWQHSDWTPQQVLRLGYSEVGSQFKYIAQTVREGKELNPAKIYCVTSWNPEMSKERATYFLIAKATRIIESKYSNRWEFVTANDLPRKSSEGLPYIKDMIEEAYSKAIKGNDIIVITNSDICFVPGLTGWILEKVRLHGAVYFHRYDFKQYQSVLISEAQAGKGKWYPGSDMFAFSKRWWFQNSENYPDMIYAREAWDMIMRNLIKKTGGTEIHKAIYHVKHASYWESADGKNCIGNKHNRKLAHEWLLKNGGDWNDWKIPINQLKYK